MIPFSRLARVLRVLPPHGPPTRTMRQRETECVARRAGHVLCRRFQPSLRHGATSTREQLVQRGLVSMINSGKDSGSKSGHFWSSDGAEPARGRPGRSIGTILPMADKEMIAAATLAAGVLAAAPPVLDPLAAAKEAASLCTEVLHQTQREAQASKA